MRKGGGLIALAVLVEDGTVLALQCFSDGCHRFFRNDVVAIPIDLACIVRVDILQYPEDILRVFFMMRIKLVSQLLCLDLLGKTIDQLAHFFALPVFLDDLACLLRRCLSGHLQLPQEQLLVFLTAFLGLQHLRQVFRDQRAYAFLLVVAGL